MLVVTRTSMKSPAFWLSSLTCFEASCFVASDKIGVSATSSTGSPEEPGPQAEPPGQACFKGARCGPWQVLNEPDDRGRYPHSSAFVIYPEGITNSQRGLFRCLETVVSRVGYPQLGIPSWVSHGSPLKGGLALELPGVVQPNGRDVNGFNLMTMENRYSKGYDNGYRML